MGSTEAQFVIIVGCGRLGSYLANRLSRDGHSVVAIDVDEAAFRALAAEYSGFRVEGDATELAVLRQAKVDKADLVVATTREDNVNLMVAQFAKRLFKVRRVMARVFDPRREDLYRALGVDTLCPTSVAADLFLKSFAAPPARGNGGPG
jgi:trk system potassium uptake protein TrkA